MGLAPFCERPLRAHSPHRPPHIRTQRRWLWAREGLLRRPWCVGAPVSVPACRPARNRFPCSHSSQAGGAAWQELEQGKAGITGFSVHACVAQAPFFRPPRTAPRQAPLSMGFSRQEYCSGLPFPSAGGSSWPRDPTWISCVSRLGRQILNRLANWEVPEGLGLTLNQCWSHSEGPSSPMHRHSLSQVSSIQKRWGWRPHLSTDPHCPRSVHVQKPQRWGPHICTDPCPRSVHGQKPQGWGPHLCNSLLTPPPLCNSLLTPPPLCNSCLPRADSDFWLDQFYLKPKPNAVKCQRAKLNVLICRVRQQEGRLLSWMERIRLA